MNKEKVAESNSSGFADKHIQYLPFGELFVSQRNGSFDSRYKFTAKELDNETNYTYFGARYYDSDISIWLSVDPLAGKYPSTSPYIYCLGNPIYYYDKDGRDGWVAIKATTAGSIGDPGHTVLVMDNYVRVENIGQNGETMYKRNGYILYENQAYSNVRNSTKDNINIESLNKSDIFSSASSYDGVVKVYETGKGKLINGEEYFSYEQVQNEYNVYNKAINIKENKKTSWGGKNFSVNNFWNMNEYNCTDFVSDLLSELGYSKNIGNINIEVNKINYSVKTPNSLFLDLIKQGKNEVIGGYNQNRITKENAVKFVESYINRQ